MFRDYNTDCLHILKVFTATVYDDEIGKYMRGFGGTKFYQLGIKLKGETDITYKNKKLLYDDNAVLYLPCEKRDDIIYHKIFRRAGVGVCVFFTSEYPLCDTAKIYKFQNSSAANAFRHVHREFQNGHYLRSKSALYEILSLLDENESSTGKSTFSEVIKHMQENVDAPYIDLSETAAKFGYSTDYFRHKFCCEIGMPPQKYMTFLKIETAKELLLNSDLRVEQIGRKTGFQDPNYFTRVFKKESGCTPTDFRRIYKKYF